VRFQTTSGVPAPTPSGLFAAMVRQWTDEFREAGFASGCPVAAATVDCAESTESTTTAAAAFARWNRPVAEALTDMGVPAERAEPLATLMISALEGALIIARAERDVRALTAVTHELGALLDGARTVSPGSMGSPRTPAAPEPGRGARSGSV
jgi:hypothetical protein